MTDLSELDDTADSKSHPSFERDGTVSWETASSRLTSRNADSATRSIPQRPPRSPLGYAVQIIIYAVALLGSCLLLDRQLPDPYLPEISNKLAYFTAHAHQYDTVFIGSSRIYHGLSPTLFDTDLHAAGRSSHSFSMAADDLKPPESLKVLDRVLRTHSVKIAFLEWTKFQIDPHTADQTTARDVAWHTTKWTWAILREIPGGRKRDLFSYHSTELLPIHIGLWLKNFTNLGRAQGFLLPSGPRNRFKQDLGPSVDGFRPRGTTVWEGVEQFRAKVDRLKQGATRSEWLDDSLFCDLMEKIAAECLRHGTRLILVIPPTLNALPKPPAGIPILSFNDPQKYPTLFSVKRRADWEHLNEAGAMEFSNALAAAYLEMEAK